MKHNNPFQFETFFIDIAIAKFTYLIALFPVENVKKKWTQFSHGFEQYNNIL